MSFATLLKNPTKTKRKEVPKQEDMDWFNESNVFHKYSPKDKDNESSDSFMQNIEPI